MIKIYFIGNSIFHETSMTVEGTMHSDLMAIVDELHEENKLPVPLYTMREALNLYETDKEGMEELENWLPINGGEYYIKGIDRVEEV